MNSLSACKFHCVVPEDTSKQVRLRSVMNVTVGADDIRLNLHYYYMKDE